MGFSIFLIPCRRKSTIGFSIMGLAVVASFLHLPFNQDGPYFKRIQFMNKNLVGMIWVSFLIVCIKYELQKLQIDP